MTLTRLPYGGRRASGIFHCLTQVVKCMMARRGYKAIVVYLDDFLVIGASLAECLEIFNCLLELLQNLGFSISLKKVVLPTQCLIFLGVLIDTISQSMSLPHDKLVALQELLLSFQHQLRASKRQLQGLAGKLNWTCRVVYGGRTFLRRILDAMNSMKSASARCLLDCVFYDDLNWWLQLMTVFNGRQLFLNSTPVVDVQTDACFEAVGAYFSGDWVYLNFGMESPVLSDFHINHKKAPVVVVAAERWANKHVIIQSDRQVAVRLVMQVVLALSHLQFQDNCPIY